MPESGNQKTRQTVHYRRVKRGPFRADMTLADALLHALDTLIEGAPLGRDVRKRCQHHEGSPPLVTVLNDTLAVTSFDELPGLAFNLCRLVPDEGMAMLDYKNNAPRPRYELRDMQPPGPNNFIRSIGYGLVVGDHAFLVQRQGLQPRQFADYLTWLLRRGLILSNEQGVELQVEFPADQVTAELDGPTGLRIGGSIIDIDQTAAEAVAQEERQGDRAADRTVIERVRSANAWTDLERVKSVFDTVFGVGAGEAVLNEYRPLHEADPNAELRLHVDLDVKSQKRSDEVQSARRQFAHRLKTTLSDFPHGMVQAKGPGYNQKGPDMRLHDTTVVELEAPDSPFLKLDHFAEQVLEIYRHFVNSGKLPQDPT